MNVILLSGGSGERLWPLSNEIRSKQFIKIFKNQNNEYESMIQRMYRNIKKIDSDANVIIATSKKQVSEIKNQLSDANVGISIEPSRRDTFPAIVLATAYLHDVQHVPENETVVVCPVDSYVEDDYFEALKVLSEQAKKGEENLVLMGIEPTCPSEKFGYIVPLNKDKISKVTRFKEKPDTETAKRYIDQGALWNSGVFAYKLKYVLDIASKFLNYTNYEDLFNRYNSLEKNSFDYVVVEKEKEIQVMRFGGAWKDLGTWNTLTETLTENIIGNGIMNSDCKNVHILNELKMPVLAIGLTDVVISASPDGILVADKQQSAYIKPFVDSMKREIMFSEKPWGSFHILDEESESMTVKIILASGHSLQYHSHLSRNEVWIVISGEGNAIINDGHRHVTAGDVIKIQTGSRHTITAISEMSIIEVQLGKEISVEDKKNFH